MKKIKIMLTTVVVLTVVGGALSFKAKAFYGNDILYSQGDAGCTLRLITLINNAGPTTLSASFDNGGDCTTFTVTADPEN